MNTISAIGFTTGIVLITFGVKSYQIIKKNKLEKIALNLTKKTIQNSKTIQATKTFSSICIAFGVSSIAMSAGIICCQHLKTPIETQPMLPEDSLLRV